MKPDLEDRTSAIGLLNYGRTYLAAAQHLTKDDVWQREIRLNFDAPILNCLGHALELMLKAHFRHQGETPEQLKKRGHNLAKLWEDAKQTNIEVVPDPIALEILNILSTLYGAPYELRYIVTGSKTYPQSYEPLFTLGQQLYDTLLPRCRATEK